MLPKTHSGKTLRRCLASQWREMRRATDASALSPVTVSYYTESRDLPNASQHQLQRAGRRNIYTGNAADSNRCLACSKKTAEA